MKKKDVMVRNLYQERAQRAAADAVVIFAVWLVGYAVFSGVLEHNPIRYIRPLLLSLSYPVMVVLFMHALEAYPHLTAQFQEIQVCIVLSNIYSAILASLLSLVFFTEKVGSILLLMLFFLAAGTVCMMAANMALKKHYENPGKYRKPSMLVIAERDTETDRLKRLKYGIGNSFYAWYEEFDSSTDLERMKKKMEEFDSVCVFNNIVDSSYEALVHHAMLLNKDIYTVPDLITVNRAGAAVTHFDDIPVLHMRKYELSMVSLFFKRVLDITVSLAGLVAAAIPMIITAIAIKLDSPGPVLYSQERYTKDKKIFKIYKFRSMVANAEALTGPVLAQKEDPRITRVGKILRKFRLDELPQLINILKGDMSIVGPRPERPFFVEKFEKEILHYNYRFMTKAGLTALSHVYGRYSTYIYDRTYYDLLYIANYSLLLDIKIILLTSKTMFVKNAAEGEDEFKKTATEKKGE